MNDFISGAWREWLEGQTVAQLNSSLANRRDLLAHEPNGNEMSLQKEIDMIERELVRRAEEANKTREAFFPRITLRKMKDATLLGQLLHSHAQDVMAMSQHVLQYKKLSDAGFPIGVTFMDPASGESSNDIEQVLSDLAERALYAAELLAAVSEEMLRLKDEEGVNLSDAENKAFDAIAQLVKDVKERES